MKIITDKNGARDPGLAEEIRARCGENVYLCYQCRKCAAGCPNRLFMDSTPTELMRYVQLGMAEEAMKGNTIWYCLSCHTCSARCPQDIDIPHVVDALRIIVQEKKIKTDTGDAALLNRLWMAMLRLGRMYEMGLAGLMNILSGHPFKDARLAAKMIRKGKIKLLPTIRKPLEIHRMFKRARSLKK
ncbi:MAG: 4Fe-4S dicluster domain-containing protein [Phycisphaerae bacterium]|nr:4Fe-4S dicluster domain-containing protein [Phycisphaerae bacterium]